MTNVSPTVVEVDDVIRDIAHGLVMVGILAVPDGVTTRRAVD